MFFDKTEYRLEHFQRSKTTGKKYDAILTNLKTGREVRVPFGDTHFQQYKDVTGLKLYTKLDHLNLDRRRLYRIRHANDIREGYFSPGYFSMRYLW